MLEALPRGARAIAYFDVADGREVRPDQFDERVQLVWLTRGDIAPAPKQVARRHRARRIAAGRTNALLPRGREVSRERGARRAAGAGRRRRRHLGQVLLARRPGNAGHGAPARD